jgi:hypothetical protein
VKLGLRKLWRRFGKKRLGHSRAVDRNAAHLLTDWSTIACRKRNVDTSRVQTSRNPAEVTCPKCMVGKPHEFRPVDRAYARVVGAGVHKKKRDDVVEWIHAVGGPEAVLRMSPLKIREGVSAYLGGPL